MLFFLCSYKHVFNGLRRVAMEGDDRDEFIYRHDYFKWLRSGSGSG